MKTKQALLLLATTAILSATAPSAIAQAQMNMAQTLSDEAQRMTIAFDGLAFVTGSLGADSFLPPGKVADFSGFQFCAAPFGVGILPRAPIAITPHPRNSL
jgi:hypothetical protein